MTPKEYAIKALPLIRAMAEGKIIQYRDKDERQDWRARTLPTAAFDFDTTEYRVAPDDPMDEWKQRLLDTFRSTLPFTTKQAVLAKFNEVFAQRPPQQFLMRPHEASELVQLALNFAGASYTSAKAHSSGSDAQMQSADEKRTATRDQLCAWINARTCD